MKFQMLQKDRTKRLGAKSDSTEIKSHPFFATINWTLLDQKKITPPYNPNVVRDIECVIKKSKKKKK